MELPDAKQEAGFTRLPGWSAAQLVIRGGRIMSVSALIGLLTVFEAYLPGRAYYWGIGFLTVCLAVGSVGVAISRHGYTKLKQERAHGYTTGPQDADDHPELYYLTRDDLQVISAPFAPRPASGRSKAVRAFAGLPEQPLYRTRRGRPLIPVSSDPDRQSRIRSSR